MKIFIPSRLFLLLLSIFILFTGQPSFSQRFCTRHAHCLSDSKSHEDKPASICTAAGLCLPFHDVRYRDFYDTSTAALNISELRASLNKYPFPISQRATLCRTIGAFLADISPHIYVQRNIHNVDVEVAFNDLANNLSTSQSPFDFHLQIVRLFMSLNDLHTVYQPPPQIAFTAAALGVTIKRFYTKPGDQPRFLITDILPGLAAKNQGLSRDATVLSIDGIPTFKLAMSLGEASYAANDAARLRVGTVALTTRSLAIDAVPTSPFATLQLYKKRKRFSIRLPWRYTTLTNPLLIEVMTRQLLPHPVLENIEESTKEEVLPPKTVSLRNEKGPIVTVISVPKPFDIFISAYVRKTSVGLVAVLRFASFNLDISQPLAILLQATVAAFPTNVVGLVVDVRQNPGGFPSFAKFVTELYSDVEIPPIPLQLRASSLTAKVLQQGASINISNNIARAFLAFAPALSSALRAGEPFAAPAGNIFGFRSGNTNSSVPFMPFPRAKQIFFGPVITLSDAATYSSGDIFAALQVDTGASLLVGTDAVTGGGGASTNSYRQLKGAFPTLLKPLPKNVGFTTAIGRFFRLGLRSGQFVEAFGVGVDVLHYETRNDIMKDDEDLFEFVGQKLMDLAKKR